jgi:hypothetical protein
MRKLGATLAIATAVLLAGSLAWTADAQTSRGATAIPAQTQNFTPIEKAACGPHRGPHCRRWHHWVCGRHHCWCAPC